MPEKNRKHLTLEMREVIQAGLEEKASARKISKRIGVSPSTVTREIKVNRTIKERKAAANAKLSVRCVHYRDCEKSGGACKKCSTRFTVCKNCRTYDCTKSCPDFVRVMCPATEVWPYVCPAMCPKKSHCGYPKVSYSALSAHTLSTQRLSESRSGIGICEEELKAMDDLITPLIKQGQSFEAIWATHADELPVGVRCAYNYQASGILSCADIELPRKVRMRPRKKSGKHLRDRVDRTGRTFDDFQALPLEDQARVVQGDSVEGFEENAQDLLSLFVPALSFHIYMPKRHACKEDTVACLDDLERACGSPEAFEAVIPILLLDRGCEFDDWEGMERSCLVPGCRRCRVFYCDAMDSNQKSQCERDHEQLRRILPKTRSDFDKLSAADVALCASHVNSYPLARRAGKCAFELAVGYFPQSVLTFLGLTWLDPDEVVLKPYLMPHVVKQ